MKENNTVPVLELSEINEESLVQEFCAGEGILYVTEHGKLAGCLTNGDIKRMLRHTAGDIDYSEYINRNNKRIVFENEEQATQEAEQIFEQFSKINNIPVINPEGTILFQYQRKETNINETIFNRLIISRLDNLFSWYEAKKCILVGSDRIEVHILERAENLIKEELSNLDITIDFQYSDYSNLPAMEGGELLLCWNMPILNWCKRKYLNDDIIIESIQQLSRFFVNSDVNSTVLWEKSTIQNWVELFSYEEVFFQVCNKHTKYLEQMLNTMGIRVCYGLSGQDIKNLYAVVCMSKDSKLSDYYSCGEFFSTLWWIQAYQDVNKCDVTRQEYIDYFISMVKKLAVETNSAVYLHYICNQLEEELYHVLHTIEDLNVKVITASSQIKKDQKIICNKKDMITDNSLLTIFSRDDCIRGLVEESIIQKIKNRCNHVYVHRQKSGHNQKFYDERHWEVYEKGFFNWDEKSFIEDMFGEEGIDLRDRIEKLNALVPQTISNSHTKYPSHFKSEFMSTDMYGNWVVDGTVKSNKHVYMIGTCLYTGLLDDAQRNIPSCLQKQLLDEGFTYQVENLSMWRSSLYTLYSKLLQRQLEVNDIVIVWVLSVSVRSDNENIILTDWDRVADMISEKYWYWDFPTHCNYHAYEIIANDIFEGIRKDLVKEDTTPEFHVEPRIEREIGEYLTELKQELDSCIEYQRILKTKNTVLGGACIMNCNPFTYGHQYLVETAARLVDILYVFVVQEDKSFFAFSDRIDMVQKGVAHLDNVVVLPSGKFMISQTTFPGYFSKDVPQEDCYDSFLDLKIFAHYIAPALNVGMRIVGEEPFDKVTKQYNEDMKAILKEQDIMVLEVPRKKNGDTVISATTVRKLLQEKNWERLKEFVPETTLQVLMQKSY